MHLAIMLPEGSRTKDKRAVVTEIIRKNQRLLRIDRVETNLSIKMTKVKDTVTKNLKKILPKGNSFEYNILDYNIVINNLLPLGMIKNVLIKKKEIVRIGEIEI